VYVVDTEGRRVSAIALRGPRAQALTKPDASIRTHGVPLRAVYGGEPERLWVLVERSNLTRALVPVDPRTLRRRGKPVRLERPYPEGLANAGGTIYFYKRSQAVENPTIGQVDTQRHLVARPPRRMSNGVRYVAASAGFIWVADDPDETVTRLK
jgi:hypothetical protein